VTAIAEPGVTVRLAARLRSAVGAERVLTDPAQLRTYECDGLANFRVLPGIVVLAESTQHVVDTVRLCAEAGVPFVARGSGTGLSGGALPVADGVLIVLSRLRGILRIDPDNARIVVEPGVINLWVSREAAPHDLAYVPDPSSQQVCSIGGNLAENSGGAHCLKYGFTVNHVMGAEIVLSDGQVVHLGGTAPEHPGYDLLGVFVGSEGTLGVATEVTLRLVRVPEAVQTMLVGFRSVEDAAGTVSDIIAAGILPAAIEMMDALAIEAAEAAVRCGYPPGAVAVLVIELDGPQIEVEAQFTQVAQLALARHAFETRIAADAAERALMWKGRKSAFAAVGRISPAYFVQDGVIPRTRLPQVLAEISRLADEFGYRLIVNHATEGFLLADLLAERNIPCIVGPLFTARSKVELRERSLANPGQMANAGVDVALTTDHPVVPINFLVHQATLAVKEGMTREEMDEVYALLYADYEANPADMVTVKNMAGILEKRENFD